MALTQKLPTKREKKLKVPKRLAGKSPTSISWIPGSDYLAELPCGRNLIVAILAQARSSKEFFKPPQSMGSSRKQKRWKSYVTRGVLLVVGILSGAAASYILKVFRDKSEA